ncbi:GAF domain-containing protein [Enterococcus sp. AZ103]|uniref:GAF domain-containing protein n=1 Tax=Enterococcus sp. AZ103 TaxID=2774628 RepID=UPI003F25B282
MIEINSWLEMQRKKIGCDFLGVAENVAEKNQTTEIRWLHVAGNQGTAYQKIRLRVGRGIAGIVWKTGRMHEEHHILSQTDKLAEYPIARTEKLQSSLAAPIIDNREVYGVVLMGYRQEKYFSENDKESLVQICEALKGKLEE